MGVNGLGWLTLICAGWFCVSQVCVCLIIQRVSLGLFTKWWLPYLKSVTREQTPSDSKSVMFLIFKTSCGASPGSQQIGTSEVWMAGGHLCKLTYLFLTLFITC